jgi:hypothetical protein
MRGEMRGCAAECAALKPAPPPRLLALYFIGAFPPALTLC